MQTTLALHILELHDFIDFCVIFCLHWDDEAFHALGTIAKCGNMKTGLIELVESLIRLDYTSKQEFTEEDGIIFLDGFFELVFGAFFLGVKDEWG